MYYRFELFTMHIISTLLCIENQTSVKSEMDDMVNIP